MIEIAFALTLILTGALAIAWWRAEQAREQEEAITWRQEQVIHRQEQQIAWQEQVIADRRPMSLADLGQLDRIDGGIPVEWRSAP